MKSDRVTIMLDKELNKKIRIIQAKEIKTNLKSVSFSKVLNSLVMKGLNDK